MKEGAPRKSKASIIMEWNGNDQLKIGVMTLVL
jgi:hypothetical protein